MRNTSRLRSGSSQQVPKSATRNASTPRPDGLQGRPHILVASAAALDDGVEDFITATDAAWQALPRMVRWTPTRRLASSGKLRDGEPAAMTAILDAIDLRPGYFHALGATSDDATAPTPVDTTAARDALGRRTALLRLQGWLHDRLTEVQDSLLATSEAARAVTTSAYPIALAIAPHDVDLATAIAPAREFFTRAVATEREKKPAGNDRPQG